MFMTQKTLLSTVSTLVLALQVCVASQALAMEERDRSASASHSAPSVNPWAVENYTVGGWVIGERLTATKAKLCVEGNEEDFRMFHLQVLINSAGKIKKDELIAARKQYQQSMLSASAGAASAAAAGAKK